MILSIAFFDQRFLQFIAGIIMSKGSTKTQNKKQAMSKEKLLKLYQDMLLIRRFEEKAGQLYGMGLIGGFCHLYIGQEAVVVGIQDALIEGDTVITSYRDHGHIIVAGMDPKLVMAELMGRETGCSKGKGGSMHMFDLEHHFYGGHGIVGAQVPLGTGMAFSHKYLNKNNISVTYYGDGAAHQGQVYESYNMAKLWQLPALYIIENNEYAMGTSVSRATIVTDLHKRGEPFGIPGKKVDGMDILAVREAALEAADYIRRGNGPMILEVKTYRYRGHSMSDPAKYRSKEEVSNMRDNRDPIENCKLMLSKQYGITEEKFKDIEKEIKNIITEAVEFAQNSKEPDEAELYTDVYTI
jgi:pyruvate dehydrogenase E1 component alpha subunit